MTIFPMKSETSINYQHSNQRPVLTTKLNLSTKKMSSFGNVGDRKKCYPFHSSPLPHSYLFQSISRKYASFKRLLMVATLLTIASIIALSLFCPESLCSSKSRSYDSKQWLSANYLFSYPTHLDHYQISERLNIDRVLLHKFGYDYEDFVRFKLSKIRMTDFDYILKANSSNVFQMNNTDVLVFLHMQKTGGSAFDRHLVRDLALPQPCKCDSKRKKKCRCFRPGTSNKYWLFSRYSIGWKCGLHADYTELVNCVERILNQEEYPKSFVLEKRNYYFITLLRDPIARFLSEFKHVQRGATWKTSRHWCDGRLPTRKEIPLCFHGPNWRNVSFEEFTSCPYNLAFNRQTRMLADLSLVGCYNKSVMTKAERDSIMLFSAKQNLRHMAFFGLCEEQLATQYMFERTFNLRFKRPFVQFNQTRSHDVYNSLSYKSIEKIRQLNDLDVELYSYAKQLFRQRFARLKEKDANFDEYYQQLIRASQLQMKKTKLAKLNKQKMDTNKLSTSHKSPNINDVQPNDVGNGDKFDDDNGENENVIKDLYDETSPIADSIDENDSVEDYYVR